MVTRISSFAFVLASIVALVAVTNYATNAAAAPIIATVSVVHQENQAVEKAGQKIAVEAEMNTTPTASPTISVQPDTAADPISASAPTTPVLVSIPSIKLNAPVVEVGLNNKGEMDVPSGDTNDVGWYKHGTVPGNEGSAVLDAHVFAALKNLRYAKVGDSIYVKDAVGATRNFIIRSSMVYRLAEVPRELLFNRTGGKYLHIITCAGSFDKSTNTYDHRLIVYAELVD